MKNYMNETILMIVMNLSLTLEIIVFIKLISCKTKATKEG